MKNLKISFALIVMLAIPVYVHAQKFEWAKSIGGTSDDWGNSIAIDASGNIYTTGYFAGIADFDPGVGTYNLTAYGSDDIFICKLNASGNLVWAKQMGGTTNDRCNSIKVTASGNIYLTGSFSGTATFGTFNLTSTGGDDIFISKLDASGNFVWAKQLGDASGDVGNSIIVDASGNVYTTGNFEGTVDFDPEAGTLNLTSTGIKDIFISKLDASGNFLWAKQFGGTMAYNYGYSIQVDASGNTYTTGYFRATTDFDPGTGIFNLTSAGEMDMFISKLDASGNFAWAKQFGGTQSDVGTGISLDASNNAYVTGYRDVPGNTHEFVRKYDESGNLVWGAGWIRSEVYPTAIALDTASNVYITGGQFTGNRSNDIFVHKYEPYGGSYDVVWSKSMGGASNDSGRSIVVDASGNLYIVGVFSTTANFDSDTGVVSLISAGGNDIFIAKYTQPSHTITTQFSSDLSYCQGASVGINYTKTGTFNVGNIFTAQLSNASGSFADPVNIGMFSGTYTNDIYGNIPNNALTGIGYRIRVVSSDPLVIGGYEVAGLFIQGSCDDTDSATLDYCINGSCIHSSFGEWSQASSNFDDINRAGAISFSIGGYGYIGTGKNIDDSTYLNDLWKYYPAIDNWVKMDTLPGPRREQAVCFVIGTNAYVGTGKNDSGSLDDFYRYSTTSNTWISLGNFDGGVLSRAVAFTVGGAGYVVGINEVWKYNEGADSWIKKNNFFWGSVDAVAFAIGNSAYLGIGNNFWEYAPSLDFWFPAGSAPFTPRIEAVGVSPLNNHAYVATGKHGTEALAEIWEFTPPNKWTQLADFPGQPRYDATGFVIGEKVFIGTGYLENPVARMPFSQNDFWAYSPGCPTCDDNNPCTLNLCDGVNCVYPAVNCNDDDACTTDQCIDGGCKHINQCDDNNPCTKDECGTNGCENTPYVCDDNNACTTDSCGTGGCVFTPIVCTVNISGALQTENGNPISGAVITLTGSEQQSDTSDVDGLYSIEVEQGANVNVAPTFKDTLTSTCVTTIDLVRMQRHILVIDTLASRYKIMAADVNGSGSVSTIDIGVTRNLILGNTTTFTNGRLWRFMQTDFQFSDTLTPFPFDTGRTYQALNADTFNQNFIGIRLGDVNGTCDIPNPRLSVAGEVQFAMEEYNKMPGDEIIIPLKVKDFKNIAGYQFTLSWNPEVLEFLDANNASLPGFYGTQNTGNGFLTTSWNDATGGAKSLNDEAVAFELKFKIVGTIGSFSPINIGSEITTSESYNDNLELLSINATNGMVNVGDISTHNTQPITRNTNLHVQPNPFSNTTNIIFDIPKNETVSIKIYDVMGKQVMNLKGDYKAGENRVEWASTDLKGNPLSKGLYLIRMTAGEYSGSVKVMLAR